MDPSFAGTQRGDPGRSHGGRRSLSRRMRKVRSLSILSFPLLLGGTASLDKAHPHDNARSLRLRLEAASSRSSGPSRKRARAPLTSPHDLLWDISQRSSSVRRFCHRKHARLTLTHVRSLVFCRTRLSRPSSPSSTSPAPPRSTSPFLLLPRRRSRRTRRTAAKRPHLAHLGRSTTRAWRARGTTSLLDSGTPWVRLSLPLVSVPAHRPRPFLDRILTPRSTALSTGIAPLARLHDSLALALDDPHAPSWDVRLCVLERRVAHLVDQGRAAAARRLLLGAVEGREERRGMGVREVGRWRGLLERVEVEAARRSARCAGDEDDDEVRSLLARARDVVADDRS